MLFTFLLHKEYYMAKLEKSSHDNLAAIQILSYKSFDRNLIEVKCGIMKVNN